MEDVNYSYPDEAVQAIRNQKAWMADPKYFKRVKVSPSATIKMLAHGQQGVEKGTSKNGKPLEVMGLLLGRPDHQDLNSIIITDAMPLPVEGFETRVIADDMVVSNYMIALGDSIEQTRKERFCGWYHTHPFDLDGTSHCYLSNTDISTQLLWQNSEDPYGNPWVAIVIDPLLSLEQEKPEMLAFRVYPPTFNPPANETPDGALIREDNVRVQKWGACWNRYYKLQIEHFMSSLARETLDRLNNQMLWQQPFVSAPKVTEKENIAAIEHATHQVKTLSIGRNRGGKGMLGGDDGLDDDYESRGASFTAGHGHSGSYSLAEQHICSICTMLTKRALFCAPSSGNEKGLKQGEFTSMICQHLLASSAAAANAAADAGATSANATIMEDDIALAQAIAISEGVHAIPMEM